MNLPFRISDVFGFDGTFQRDFGGRKENGDLVQNLGSILGWMVQICLTRNKIASRNLPKRTILYILYVYNNITKSYCIYLYMSYFHYIYINTLILWQTANWNFTLDSTRKPAVCRWGVPRETPKDGSRFRNAQKHPPVRWEVGRKMCLEVSKTMSEFRWLLCRDTEMTQRIIWIALQVILFFWGGDQKMQVHGKFI